MKAKRVATQKALDTARREHERLLARATASHAVPELIHPLPPPRGFFTTLPSTELVASLHGALIQTINYGVKPSDLDLLRDECVRRGLL
jgi:hypothetical protein